MSNTGFPYYSADASWTGYGSSNGCGFMRRQDGVGTWATGIDQSHPDMKVGVAMHAAHGNAVMPSGYGAKCGVCIKLTGAPAVYDAGTVEAEGNNAKAGWTKVVKVVDVLNPDESTPQVNNQDFMFDVPGTVPLNCDADGNNCELGWKPAVGLPFDDASLDIFSDASQVTNPALGRIPVTWEEVPCAEHNLADWTHFFETRDECAANDAQCGGNEYTGPTCCQHGYTCQAHSQWFSTCKPHQG